MSRLPIRVRVTAAFAVAMAAVLAASGLYLYLRLDAHLTAALDRDLRLRAQDLAALVSQPHSTLAKTLVKDESGRFVERGESYAQLLSRDGRVLGSTRPLGRHRLLSPAELRRAERGSTYVDRQAVPGLNEPSRLLATTVARSSGTVVLVVGATQQNNAETLASLRDELLLAGPLALLLASALGYLLAGLSLRQVESMRRRAAAISAEKPGGRLPVLRTGDELQRLGETLNEMLARMEIALERERDFVADAGHELRTPLALLRTELELALRHARTADDLRAAIRWSSHEADRLSQLAEDLLLMARTDRGRLPLRVEAVPVDALFASVESRFEWRAAQLGKTVTSTAADGIVVEGDRLRLEQALGNLVDNALRHGGNEIVLAAAAGEGRIALHVRDNGAGYPPEFLARAFERFSRADAARGGGGAGLGLSIVKAIAESHDGEAHIANSSLATDSWLILPAARSDADGGPAEPAEAGRSFV